MDADPAIMKAIRALPKKQRDALDRVCMGDDSGSHPATMQALERKGLVEPYESVMSFRDGLPPMTVTRYGYSIPVHMAWCQVGSEEYDADVKAGCANPI